MTRFVVDASAWIEYFQGSAKGAKVKELAERRGNELVTNTLTFSEIVSVFERRGLDGKAAFDQALSESNVFTIDSFFSRDAGLLHAEVRKKVKDFGLADAFVLATARKLGAKLITTDSHFKGFKETILL